jgi:hypothetical protein
MTLLAPVARKPGGMKTTLRRSHPILAALAAALALAACGQTGTGTSSTPRATATPQATRALQTCFGAAPAGWAGLQRAALPTTQFEPQVVAPSGDRVFGSYRTTAGEQGIASMDLTSGALKPLIASPAGTAGVLGLAVAPPWLAWVQGMGQQFFGPWVLHARNLDTGEELTPATGVAGIPVPGPFLHGTELAWVQSTSVDLTAPAGELRVYDLAAHKQSILDSGSVGSPVLAGPYLVWTHDAGGAAALQAVDASTLLPAALPARLRAQTGIRALAGSPDYLVWDTDRNHGAAWRFDRGQLTTYTVAEPYGLQFITVASHFLLWTISSPPGSLVIDLNTGGGYLLPSVGLAGSEAAIVRTDPLGASNPKSGSPGNTVSVLATSSAPAIPGCRG